MVDRTTLPPPSTSRPAWASACRWRARATPTRSTRSPLPRCAATLRCSSSATKTRAPRPFSRPCAPFGQRGYGTRCRVPTRAPGRFCCPGARPARCGEPTSCAAQVLPTWARTSQPCAPVSSRLVDRAMRLHYHPGIHPGDSIMPTALEAESTLTDRYQTTVPETVRRALRLGKRDKIHYAIQPTGEVVLTRADAGEDDPVLGKFLDFLARDIAEHPERLQPLTVGFVQRAQELAAGIEVDLDAPLSPEDECLAPAMLVQAFPCPACPTFPRAPPRIKTPMWSSMAGGFLRTHCFSNGLRP